MRSPEYLELDRQLNRVRNRFIDLEEKVEKIRELHAKVNGPADNYICEHCTWDEYRDVNYPCETIRLLDGDLV